MSSCHGFIKYTVEVFTQDEDLNESRGEKEIIIVAPISEKIDVSNIFSFCFYYYLNFVTNFIQSSVQTFKIESGFINLLEFLLFYLSWAFFL